MRIEDFSVVDHYAEGGIAQVYRAIHKPTGRIAVIKRLKSSMLFDEVARGGFEREILIAPALSHPNLNKGLFAGEHSSVPFLVLEYIDGVDLGRLAKRSRSAAVNIPKAAWLYTIAGILRGMAFAHQLGERDARLGGLVHRDLSPKNIFLDVKGEVRVGDFGAAYLKDIDGPVDYIIGSPGYMSPEQATMGLMDGRSDVYAVGCIAYELLVGTRAFDTAGMGETQVLDLHAAGNRNAIPQGFPKDLSGMLERSTATDPRDRYQSAQEMLEAVEDLAKAYFVQSPDLLLASVIRGLFGKELDAQRPTLENAREKIRFEAEKASNADLQISLNNEIHPGEKAAGKASKGGTTSLHVDTTAVKVRPTRSMLSLDEIASIVTEPQATSTSPSHDAKNLSQEANLEGSLEGLETLGVNHAKGIKQHVDDLKESDDYHGTLIMRWESSPSRGGKESNNEADEDQVGALTQGTLHHLNAHHGDFKDFADLMVKSHSNRFGNSFWATIESMGVSTGSDESIRIVDFGTGPGLLLVDLAKRFPKAELHGVEAQPEMLKLASQSLKGIPDAQIHRHDLMSGPIQSLGDKSIDLAFAVMVLHELPVPTRLVRDLARTLKPGGQCVLCDWVRFPLQDYFESEPSDSQDRFTHFSEHCRYTAADLKWLLEAHGLHVQDWQLRNRGRHALIVAKKPES